MVLINGSVRGKLLDKKLFKLKVLDILSILKHSVLIRQFKYFTI